MSETVDIPVTIHHPETRRQLANVILNGHNIQAGGPLGLSGMMRSFRLLDGDLWDVWNQQLIVIARMADGTEYRIRIAAIPSKEGVVGFVEFT